MCDGPALFQISKDEVEEMIDAKLRSIDASVAAAEALAPSAPADAQSRVARWIKNGREEAERVRAKLVFAKTHLAPGLNLVSASEIESLRCDYRPFDVPARIPISVLRDDEGEKMDACMPVSYRNSPF